MEKDIKLKVKSGLSWAFAEKMLTELMFFIISIVMARLIAPEEYGVIALVQVFITITSIFVSFGLGSAIVQKKELTNVQVSSAFYLNLIFGIILYCVLFLSAPAISAFYNNDRLTNVVRVLSIKVPIASVYSIQQSFIQKRMEFKKFFFSSLSGTLIAGIVGIILAYKGFGVWALVAFTLIDQVVDSIVLFITTKWLPRFVININESKPLIAFGKNVLLAELVSRGYDQIRLLVIGKAYSGADLAYNSKGQTIPSAIIDITNTTIIRVMFPAFSQLQDDKVKMKQVASKSIRLSSFVLAPALIGLAAMSYRLVPLLYTEKWNSCIPYLQLYCLTYLLQPIHSINIKIIQACGRSDISFRIELIKKIAGLVFIAIAVLIFDSPIYVAASFTAMSVIALIINAVPCRRLIDYGLIEELKDIFPALMISFIMGLIVVGIGNLPLGGIIIAVQLLAGIVSYVFLSFIFRLEAAQILKEHLLEFVKHGKD